MAFLMITYLQPAAADSDDDAGGHVEANMASTYVPLESWVYPAFDRLAAMGYVQTAFNDLRPWTRMDCARLIDEAEELRARDITEGDADGILKYLRREFAEELGRRDGAANRGARIESLTQRSTGVAGRPLTDGYHFGQTLVNDDGRPFGQGFNSYTGIAARANAGPFAAYIHAELQRVPSAPSRLGPLAQESIAAADFTPTAAAGPGSDFLSGRLLDASISFTHSNNQFTFGKQSLWWGPGRGSAMLLTNNSEPIAMLRYDRLRPIELPGVLKLLGPIRAQFFVGRLEGHQFVHPGSDTLGTSGAALANQPFLHGEKISFKPNADFEFSVARTGVFGGSGSPVTATTFARSLFSTGNGIGSRDPGDRRAAFDAQYRLPGMRNCLTAYVDTFSEDEPFPLAYPTESAWSPGFMLACIPHLPHATVRAEGQLTPHRDLFPGFYYFNVHYLSGYTNNRNLIGSWIGREAQGGQVWGTWWLSATSSLEASVRSMTTSAEFLHGGTLRDLDVSADVAVRPAWRLRISTQIEQWRFPLLAATTSYNAATTVQVTYQPEARAR